jgi:pimeloyl-ACP methyl ester carboxylesterase
MVPTRLGAVHVVASGPAGAPPIVLLHAFFATALAWMPNVAALSAEHRVYAVDIPGEPTPSQPLRTIADEDDAVAWFSDLLAALGIERSSIVGNSNGAFLGTLFAMRLPERVDRLVLISPAATFHSIWPFYLHMFVPKVLAMIMPWLPGHDRRIRHSIEWAENGIASDEDWRRLFFLGLRYGNTATQVVPRVFTAGELKAVTAPTLLIVGDREVIYRPEQVIAAAIRLMPGIQTALVAGAHHIAAMAQPEAVNRLIIEFLR